MKNKSDLEKAVKGYDEMKRENEELLTQARRAAVELKAIEAQKTQCDAELQKLNNKMVDSVPALELQVDDLKKQLEEANAAVKDLRTKLQTQEAGLTEAKAQATEAQRLCNELVESEKAELQKENQGLRETHNSLQIKIKELTDEINYLQRLQHLRNYYEEEEDRQRDVENLETPRKKQKPFKVVFPVGPNNPRGVTPRGEQTKKRTYSARLPSNRELRELR